MQYGLSLQDIQKIQAVFASFPEVESVVLYGSRAKGNYKKGSDIDITLLGEKLNLTLLNRIKMEIEELFLPYLFDISIFHQISHPELLQHIQRIGKIMYQKT